MRDSLARRIAVNPAEAPEFGNSASPPPAQTPTPYRRWRWLSLTAIGLSILCLTSLAAEPPAGESTNRFAAFHLQKGFRMELVASEPDVVTPVAMAFDEDGRLFVAEMASPAEGAKAGRIRLLEEPEGTGSYTASTVFAENVPWVSSIACYKGGVFAASTPDILYLKDTRHDRNADLRQSVFTGFGGGTESTAPDALINSLQWGPDNRIHGLAAGLGGKIRGSSSDTPLDLGRNDFSFDPRRLVLRPEVGPGQSGLAFDSRGRKFVTDSTRPLRYPTYALRRMARNPFAPAPLPLIDVESPNTPLTVLPASDEKPASPAAKGAGIARQETNTSSPTYFTSARGTVVYRGTAYPTGFVDNVFIADPAARVIHRVIVRDNGLFPTAERPAGAGQSEFLACTDPDFNPSQIVNGPEGVLYVADRGRGANRGRIYRIVPETFKRPPVPRLGKASTYDLVASLAQPNGWQSDTAQRLLYERQDPASIGLLTNMVNNSRVPSARILALRALQGLGALDERVVLKGMRDTDARVREQAAAAAEDVLGSGPGSDAFRTQLQTLAADPFIGVRYQLAFALAELRRPGREQLLADILMRDPANPWIQSAVLSSLSQGDPEFLGVLCARPWSGAAPALQRFVPEVARMVGVRGQPDQVSQLVGFLSTPRLEAQLVYRLLYSLGDGLHRSGGSLEQADPRNTLKLVHESALRTAVSTTASAAVRADAVRALGVGGHTFVEVADWLLLLIDPKESYPVQSATLSTLLQFKNPRAASEILKRWPLLPPGLRREAVSALLRRSGDAAPLLAGLTSGAIRPGDLLSTQLDMLRTYPDPAISSRATQAFGPVQFQRPELMGRYRPAVRLSGSAGRGREIFALRCAVCHAPAGGDGAGRLWLSAPALRGKEQLLSAILEPNAQIAPEDKTCLVETTQMEAFVGIVTDDNPVTVALASADGTVAVLPRTNIQAVRPQSWSLMPTGLETGLTVENMADLLEYLASLK